MQSFKDSIITAEPFDKKGSQEDKTESNLFVKNLAPKTTQKDILELFSKYGEIRSIKLKQNNKGECSGLAYVGFENRANAQDAMEGLNGYELNDKKLYIAFYSPIDKTEGDIKFPAVVIKQLPSSV